MSVTEFPTAFLVGTPTSRPSATISTSLASPAPEIDRTRIYVSSVLWTTALFFFGVGVPCWIAADLAWGAGLGAMCAFWGGPGFGVMAAGARISAREEKLHAHHSPSGSH